MIESSKPNKPRRGFSLFGKELWIYAIILGVLGALFLWDGGSGETKSVSWDEFQRLAKQESFSKIIVDRGEHTAVGMLRPSQSDSLYSVGRSPIFGRVQPERTRTV